MDGRLTRILARFRPWTPELRVPVHYNHLVQGMIYSSLNPAMAGFLHDRGFPLEGRAFRLFTFSRLMGAFQRDGDELVFAGPVRLWVASPVQAIVEELAATWLREGTVQMGSSQAEVEAVDLVPVPDAGSSALVRTLSPVTVYETLRAPDGRSKTYYYSPSEREFGPLCAANARRKLQALSGRVEDSALLQVSPAGWQKHRQVIVSYKGTVVKAWHGAFRLEGSPELIRMVLDAGLGSKNAQGFGMVEIWEGGR